MRRKSPDFENSTFGKNVNLESWSNSVSQCFRMSKRSECELGSQRGRVINGVLTLLLIKFVEVFGFSFSKSESKKKKKKKERKIPGYIPRKTSQLVT